MGNNKIQIDISKLFGIHKAIADKANLDHNEYLEGTEISIFNQTRKTINKNTESFIFCNEMYDKNGDKYDSIYKQKATPVYKYEQYSIEDVKQYNELKKADEYGIDENIGVVKTNHKGKQEYVVYNIKTIEDYIINDGVDNKGNQIKYFSRIPEIRKNKNRTEEEQNLLNEFNSLIKNIISAAKDYGVDPKRIVAIIQQEVAFDGTGKNRKVTGSAGQGYMQITSAPIEDFLGMDGYNQLKEGVYGKEMTVLLKSRGFDVDALNDKNCPKAKRKAVAKAIMKYLKNNTDYEFNIRLGTLILRKYLNSANGNFKTAATNYNGSKSKYAYGKRVARYYQKLDNKQRQNLDNIQRQNLA